MSKKQNLWLPGMDESYLILPEEISDLLEIQIPVDSTDAEFEAMILVNDSSQSFMAGEIDLDFYMDVLDSVGKLFRI